jgi:diguanylate cyclase (GGDEF)-like protein
MRSERSTDAYRTLAARALELENDSHRDPLTGLYNAAWFDGQLAELFGETHDKRTALTVMLADIDGLHAINQAHGHLAGDKVIFSVAACLKRQLRPRDLVARHAGAAFAVLLPRAPSPTGRIVAERLRAGVADVEHDVAIAHALHVTISVGCATLERGGFTTRDQIMDAAGLALSAAKRGGRDRVVALVDKPGESLDRPGPTV